MTHQHRGGLWSKMISLAATVALAGAAETENVPALRDVFKDKFDTHFLNFSAPAYSLASLKTSLRLRLSALPL